MAAPTGADTSRSRPSRSLRLPLAHTSGKRPPWTRPYGSLSSPPLLPLIPQAERLARKGPGVSENASLAIWRVLEGGPLEIAAPSCLDEDSSCEAWAAAGECERNTAFMRRECRLSCDVCAAAAASEHRAAAVGGASVGRAARGRASEGITTSCIDRREQCEAWAATGECERNAAYMESECGRSCGCGSAQRPSPGQSGPLSSHPRPASCMDSFEDCARWTNSHPAACSSPMAEKLCARSCGLCADTAEAPRVEAPTRQQRAKATANFASAGQCEDQVSTCTAIIGSSPRACATAPMMRTSCRRSCGYCGDGGDAGGGKDEL